MRMPTFKISKAKKDAFLKSIINGASKRSAAAAAGIAYSSLFWWFKEAKRIETEVNSGEVQKSKLSKGQVNLLEFLDNFRTAKDLREAQHVGIVAAVAQGGIETQETHEEIKEVLDSQTGKIRKLKTHKTVVKKTLPNWQAAWRLLESQFSDKYGSRLAVSFDLKELAKKAGLEPNDFERRYKDLVAELAAGLAGRGDKEGAGGGDGESPTSE